MFGRPPCERRRELALLAPVGVLAAEGLVTRLRVMLDRASDTEAREASWRLSLTTLLTTADERESRSRERSLREAAEEPGRSS